MQDRRRLAFIFLLSSSLSGCATPFAERANGIDWSGKPAPGTILVSDPKMYRREALINERRDTIAWLDDQITASRTIEFKPEIAREVEQITSLSAALGLSFDPASGLNFRQSKETSDLQQQIDTTKLQLQLDQLRRDADLVRSKFGDQTDPVNSDVGKLGTGSATPVTSSTAAAAADQLKAAVDKLNANLTSRLDADGKPAALANTTENPIDLFRDRSALRDTLQAARNAAGLDELHDFNGAALIRLNFQATVLPDRKLSAVPGVIQMNVVAPDLSDSDKLRMYKGWLSFINERINIWQSPGWQPNTDFLRSAVADNFDIVRYFYATPHAQPAAPAIPATPKSKKQAKAKPAPKLAAKPIAAPATCPGLAIEGSIDDPAGCSSLVFAIPRFLGTSPQEGATSSLSEYAAFFNLGADDGEESRQYEQARQLLAVRSTDVVQNCNPPSAPPVAAGTAPDPAQRLYDQLKRARVRASAGDVLATIDRLARRMLAARNIPAPDDERLARIAIQAARAQMLLSSLEQFAYTGCTGKQRSAFRTAGAQPFLPGTFKDLLSSDGRIAIYEIGPREQVQQLSTVARAANSLALAVSVAASAPSSGVAANAAGSYAKQSMGRAATLERVPAVVGYSLLAQHIFGWVIGPRATINPKGRMDLDQTLRAFDLSVDLSVPSWWPYFTLQTVTGWAPDVHAISAGAVQTATHKHGDAPTGLAQVTSGISARVDMSANDADYGALTTRLSFGDTDERRQASLIDPNLSGQAVAACRATSIALRGDNLWRSTVAIIGGTKLAATAISVSPDMSGVVLDVPALDNVLGDVSTAKVSIALLTPYGQADGMVDYIRKPVAGCSPTDKKVADGPGITSVEPLQIQAPASVTFHLVGSKLDQVNRVTLNGQASKPTAAKDGKSLDVTFSADQTRSLPVSRTIPLSLYKDDEKLGEKLIEVTANSGGN